MILDESKETIKSIFCFIQLTSQILLCGGMNSYLITYNYEKNEVLKTFED
jgi:hypothetical protein